MQPKTRIMGENMQKVAAVQGQMTKINDRLRKNPKHPGAGKDRTDLLDLQRKMVALRKSRNESVDELAMYTSKKLPNLSYPKKKTKHEKERDRLAMMRKNKQKGESARDDRLAALKKQHDRQKKQDDANLSKLRYARGMKEEMSFAVSIEGLPQMFISADSPGMLKQTLRKIVKQPSMIQSVKRVTDAQVKKTFRLKAQGREEEDQE